MMQTPATIAMMPPVASLHLQSPLSDIPALPVPTLRMLEKEGYASVGDLLLHMPSRHEDRRHMDFKGFSPAEAPVCHHVKISRTRVLRFGRRGGVFEAEVQAATGGDSIMSRQLTLRWFNMVFLQRALAMDMELMIYGKIKEVKTRLVMDHPDYEVLQDEDAESPHTGRIVPVYRLRGGLKQKPLRAAIALLLEHLDDAAISDLLPKPKAGGEFATLSRARALRTLHCPDQPADLEQARRYLALEEFYIMQLRAVRRRRDFKQTGGWSQQPEGRLLQDFLRQLPFDLTAAQTRCLEEIRRDMALPSPMNRLLHGDVGSGKTVVALAAMLLAVESGQQAALMAPTQILAEQHHANASRWLEPLGLRVALRTGDKNTEASGLTLFDKPDAPARPHLLVGTHALLYDDAALDQLGIVVIDEQHKFGVGQRARLIARGRAPDVLVMTATPIPRTLTLTLYGDLDISTLDERPKARGKLITAVREITKLADVVKFVREQLDQGRQAYIVYPLIDESEKLDASSAVSGFAEWTKHLAPHSAGLLHGRMSPEEKESVMSRFRAGSIQALVSTTVIEVGVDVPNATVMLIHDAARFGLAQLHQLRGRIGRGEHASFCVLFIPKGDNEARERLLILEETHDGFRIAEEDLRRRGPGDVLGQAQSGQAPLLFGSLLADTRLVTLARRLAERTLAEDPQLAQPRHQELQKLAGIEVLPTEMMQ